MAKMEAIRIRRYADEFKLETVSLAQSIGGNAAARRLGVPRSTITNWVRSASRGALAESQGDGASLKRPVGELEAEVRRLQRELASTKLDLEIAKNAVAHFAKVSR